MRSAMACSSRDSIEDVAGGHGTKWDFGREILERTLTLLASNRGAQFHYLHRKRGKGSPSRRLGRPVAKLGASKRQEGYYDKFEALENAFVRDSFSALESASRNNR
jgi:hypothetical protein